MFRFSQQCSLCATIYLLPKDLKVSKCFSVGHSRLGDGTGSANPPFAPPLEGGRACIVFLPALQAQTRFRTVPQSTVEPPNAGDRTYTGENPGCKMDEA